MDSDQKTAMKTFRVTERDQRAIDNLRRNLERAWPKKFSAGEAIRYALRSHPLARPTQVNSGCA